MRAMLHEGRSRCFRLAKLAIHAIDAVGSSFGGAGIARHQLGRNPAAKRFRAAMGCGGGQDAKQPQVSDQTNLCNVQDDTHSTIQIQYLRQALSRSCVRPVSGLTHVW